MTWPTSSGLFDTGILADNTTVLLASGLSRRFVSLGVRSRLGASPFRSEPTRLVYVSTTRIQWATDRRTTERLTCELYWSGW
jgi:hypothetical protein